LGVIAATLGSAVGLAFFKLSVGMGAMTTYGSYIGKDESLIGTGVKVVLADTLVSMLAGMAIFPAVFAFDFSPDKGPCCALLLVCGQVCGAHCHNHCTVKRAGLY